MTKIEDDPCLANFLQQPVDKVAGASFDAKHVAILTAGVDLPGRTLRIRLVHRVALGVLLCQLHAQLLHQAEEVPEEGKVPGGAHLYGGALWREGGVDAATQAVPGLQNQQVGPTSSCQPAGQGQAGESGPNNQHICGGGSNNHRLLLSHPAQLALSHVPICLHFHDIDMHIAHGHNLTEGLSLRLQLDKEQSVSASV